MLLAGQAGAAPRLAVTTPLPEMVATLNGFQPEALTAYPSVAAALAEEQLQGWARPGGWTRSTSTGPPRPSWSPPGARGRTAMDVLEDLVVVEVADRRGRPVAPGVPGHKALLTSLVSRVQPLLRYELTDSVTVAEGPNPLGLPYARIAAVDGRSDDIVTLPAPGGGRVAVHPFPQPVGVVRGAAGGPPVPGRARPRRAAGGGRAARVGPGRHPGPDPGRPGPRARRRRRGPIPDRGHPRPRIDRDPGHGAKLVTSEAGSA